MIFKNTVILGSLVILILAGTWRLAGGQTDYSLRMRALGTALSGIVDDPISDAYRNPARVGTLAGTQAYAGKFPNKSTKILYPSLSGYNFEAVPVEEYSGYSSLEALTYTPLSFSVFRPVTGALFTSLTLETAVKGSSRMDSSADLAVYGFPDIDRVRSYRDGYADQNDLYYVLVDWALANSNPEPDHMSLGVRATAQYVNYEYGYLENRNYFYIDTDDLTQVTSSHVLRRRGRTMKDWDAALSGGMFRPGAFFREWTLGVGANAQEYGVHARQLSIEDEDYDGDGWDPGGHRPLYSYNKDRYQSDREYTSFRTFTTAAFEVRKNVRATLGASWAEGSGDGDALYRIEDERYDTFLEDIFHEALEYAYDGKMREYTLSSVLGLADEIYDGIVFAVGAGGFYSRTKFDEDADGAGRVRIAVAGSDSTVMLPFCQRVWARENLVSVEVPASLEWRINPYFTFRVGLKYYASRSELETASHQSFDIFGLAVPIDVSTGAETHRINYATGIVFSSGFEFNLKDKLVVEFLSSSSSSLDLSSFYYASLRYLF